MLIAGLRFREGACIVIIFVGNAMVDLGFGVDEGSKIVLDTKLGEH